MPSEATGGFVTRRRPLRRFALPRAADAAIIREADELRPARRYLGATVRPSRAQLIDFAMAIPITCSAWARRWYARTASAGSGRARSTASRSRCAGARRSVAFVAIVAVQGLAHDATYNTDPLSPFLAELILMFTVAYQLRVEAGAARLLRSAVTYVVIDFSSGRIDEIVQAVAQGRLLPARVGGSGGIGARSGGRPRGGRAPRRARGAGTRGAGARRRDRGARADRP